MPITDILNNTPFSDPNLKATIKTLQRETPEVTYYTEGTESLNAGNVAVTVLAYTIEGQPLDRPFELKLEAILAIKNNLGVAADQEFTIDLLDGNDSTILTFGIVDIDSTETGDVLVKVEATYRSMTAGNVGYGIWEYSVKTDVDGTASIVSGSPNYGFDYTLLDTPTVKIAVTPETGTATTTVQLYSAKVTLDRQIWN